MPVRTSKTHPIRVDFLPIELPGRIGLTLAPGKHAGSKSGAPWRRELGVDLDVLRDEAKIDVLVCLLEDRELERMNIGDLLAQAKARGIETHRLPIPDGGVLPDVEAVRGTVELVINAAKTGKNVLIHCAGGLGRAGTIAGCVLVELGEAPSKALDILHRTRGPNCPETEGQREFIRRHARERRTHRSDPPDVARLEGCVLGAAIGDAIGHPTEFIRSFEDLRARFGPNGVRGFELYWTSAGGRFAPYTDDTQMAEAVLRALLDGRRQGADIERTMELMAVRFVEWGRSPQGGHRAPGNACLAGCAALASGVRWNEAGGANAGGCGSVMRAYPFGLLFRDDLERAEEWAVAHSKLTHRAPIALAACGAMAVGTARALKGDTPDATLEGMVRAAARYSAETAAMMERAIEESRAGVVPETTLERLQGWAAHECIAAACYVFARHADDPKSAILEAANTPGDSDSIATLVGALVGGRCGIEALPAEWVRDVERSEELRSLATAAAGDTKSKGA